MEFWCLNVNRLKSQNQPAKFIVHSRSIERSVGQKHLIIIIERNSHICAARYFPLMNLSTKELVKNDLWRFLTWDLELSQ